MSLLVKLTASGYDVSVFRVSVAVVAAEPAFSMTESAAIVSVSVGTSSSVTFSVAGSPT